MAEELLVARGLRKRFDGRTAVDGVDLTVHAGETYGLLGPNGAGKTTTVSMVCGLLAPDEGTVEVAGLPMHPGAVDAKAQLGLVPQDVALYPDLTARENLHFFGRLYGLTGGELARRTDEVLEVVGLRDRADDRVDTFSGGMQRRLNIAVALLHRPRLLVLDEPTVGVDPQSRNAILTTVEQLAAAGTAVLYTTHYMEEAEKLCDRVGIIDHGRIIAEGTRRELVARVGQRDRIRLVAHGPLERLAAELRAVPGVVEVSTDGDGLLVLSPDGRAVLPALIEVARRTGVAVRSVEVTEPDLEAVFLHLTGRALRD